MQEAIDRIPTISRVLSDGTLVELVCDANAGETKLARCLPDGMHSLESRIKLANGDVLVPYSPHNNLLTTGCVLLPSEIGEVTDKVDLLKEIKAHIHAYVELSPLFEDIAAHYVLLSWVHDAFHELAGLRFQGEFGSGKTRALLVIGSLCYKPIFASGASTVSPLFHLLHEFAGTLILDEADFRYSDATADLTKILNNGTVKGMPVLRTLTNRHRELNPHAFTVFGPKLVAMRERFQDEALESRFLTEGMHARTLRDGIPIHLPDSQKTEALGLRNKLLRWRFDHRRRVSVDETRAVPGLSPRGNQTALALMSLIDNPELRDAVGSHLAMAEARGANRRASLPHIAMVGVLHRQFSNPQASPIKIAEAVAEFNSLARARGESSVSPKSAGHIIRAKLGLETVKTGGVYVIPAHEKAKVAELAGRYGTTVDLMDNGRASEVGF